MRRIPLCWAALALPLLLLGLTTHLDHASAAASFGASPGLASSWQRAALFGRNSRNLRQRNFSPAASDAVGEFPGTFDVIAGNLNNNNNNNKKNEFDQLFSPYAMQQQQPQQQVQQQSPLVAPLRQQQTEVYGIVEPLIEDTPCANRPCILNDDCCLSGFCSVNTSGEGKCVYVIFGRQRDLCQRHADCPAGSACMLAPQEGIWRCETDADMTLLQDVFNVRQKHPHQLGSECSSSSECEVNNGMCCQQQRLNHRAAPKLTCGYFRDAFDCVDMSQEHLANAFQHRRI